MQGQKDSFSMPHITNVINQLGKNEWFMALDLQFGFWQIKMCNDDNKKIAVITKKGLYEWMVMPFALVKT